MKSHSGGKKKKLQLSLRQALPTRVSPFETQCPAYPPQSTFDWAGLTPLPLGRKRKEKGSPHPVGPGRRSEGNQTGRDDSSSASLPLSLPPLSLPSLTKFESDCVCNSPLRLNKAALLSEMSFIYCRCVVAVCALPPPPSCP